MPKEMAMVNPRCTPFSGNTAGAAFTLVGMEVTVLTTTVVPLVSVDVLVREGGVVIPEGVVVGNVGVTTVVVVKTVVGPDGVGVVPGVVVGVVEGGGVVPGEVVVTRGMEGVEGTHWMKRC